VIVVRRQAALLGFLAGVASAASTTVVRAEEPPARPGGPVADLGRAYVALRAGDFDGAQKLAPRTGVVNRDYALYVAAQASAMAGDPAAALPLFRAVAGVAGSRFQTVAAWRAADCLWDLGQLQEARAAYERLVGPPAPPPRVQTSDISDSPLDGDDAVGLARIAQAQSGGAAIATWRRLALEHPAHPLSVEAVAALARAGAPLGARDRLERAERLSAGRGWEQALEELALVTDSEPDEVRTLRDYLIATTLFRMRRQYDRAAALYLAVAPRMGARAAEALFHGARAYSRADQDDDAIRVYGEVVRRYPATEWAAEAQFLAGWLDFNRGRFRAALPALRSTVAHYGTTKFAADAVWYLGFSHYLLGEPAEALPYLDKVAARGGRLEGGKGRYWRALALGALGRDGEDQAELARLVAEQPYSWYALLARARLAAAGRELGPFGDRPAAAVTTLAPIDPALAADPLIARVDELLAAGLATEAGLELHRGEGGFLRAHGAARGLPVLFDRYDRAGNANRPWELADDHGGRALDQPPRGEARPWWEHAYPRAYREFVERHQALGENPPYYLYSIMRKESGYDPHVVSYADAIGLLQMIPPTTRRVARELGLGYTDDLLYDPEENVRVGSWYIGHLALKFKEQIPIAAGSFNCGPRPVMRWLEQFGQRPLDEFVERVAYTQTREYMKKVTEIYARYLALYEDRDYRQPLTVDAAYLVNDLDY
jgi:soluble lytic murein transglycosylase